MTNNVIGFKSAADVRARYPGMWNVSTGKWGQVIKKTFGPYIATCLLLYGQQVRYRVKELQVDMDDKGEFTKSFIIRGAGRASSNQAARNHIEEVILPRLLAFTERRELAREVEKSVG